MSSQPMDVQKQYRRELAEMVKQGENQECADCNDKRPDWASTTLGTFICLRCAGLHRGLGVHISFVRSITMDSWTAKQMETMRRVGNCKARLYYEANKPENIAKPSNTDAVSVVKTYIDNKYVRKIWIPKGEPAPHEVKESKKNSNTKSSTTSSTKTSSVASPSSPNPSKNSGEEIPKKTKSLIDLSTDFFESGDTSALDDHYEEENTNGNHFQNGNDSSSPSIVVSSDVKLFQPTKKASKKVLTKKNGEATSPSSGSTTPLSNNDEKKLQDMLSFFD